jgi:H/ACA ribonucleoprotein complex subunit 4
LHELHEAKAVLEESGDEAPLRRLVRPVEDAVSFLRQIRIRDTAVESLCQGAQLAVPGILSFSAGIQMGDMVRILSAKGELVTISECRMSEAELRSSEHGIAAITRRVVMEQGTYPKMWRSKSDEAIAEDTKQLLIKASELDVLEQEEVDDSATSTTQK